MPEVIISNYILAEKKTEMGKYTKTHMTAESICLN